MKIRCSITGPESSGKTVLTKSLADLYNAQWVPEYARKYLIENGKDYVQNDLDIIANAQAKEWKALKDSDLVFYDTDFYVLKVWSKVKYDSVSELISNHKSEQKIDHYFLCLPDIPWEFDELREHPESRMELFEMYKSYLLKDNCNFTIVSGSLEKRINTCRSIIDDLISKDS